MIRRKKRMFLSFCANADNARIIARLICIGPRVQFENQHFPRTGTSSFFFSNPQIQFANRQPVDPAKSNFGGLFLRSDFVVESCESCHGEHWSPAQCTIGKCNEIVIVVRWKAGWSIFRFRRARTGFSWIIARVVQNIRSLCSSGRKVPDLCISFLCVWPFEVVVFVGFLPLWSHFWFLFACLTCARQGWYGPLWW